MTRFLPLLPASAVLAVALACPVQAQSLFPQWEISLQRLLSGLRVSGAQSSGTALQITNGDKASAEAVASTLVSQDNALRLARAQHEYGFDTGTGYAACTVALGLAQESDSVGQKRMLALHGGSRERLEIAPNRRLRPLRRRSCGA